MRRLSGPARVCAIVLLAALTAGCARRIGDRSGSHAAEMSDRALVDTVMQTRDGTARAKTLWTPIGRA